ncbi:MAG: GGDEF domain-containing protein [Burkholderiales bacterium]|nr:GGDEF domain-containing protein [Burkholderiales bacterium]
MTPPPPPAQPIEIAAAARAEGFRQAVHAMRRTLVTTPLGWLLVAWMASSHVPLAELSTWLAVFGLSWGVNLGVLWRVARDGGDGAWQRRLVLGVAVADGLAWGLMFALMSGRDAALDSALGAVLAGVGAINAPVYITLPRGYRALIGSMWLLAACAYPLHPQPLSVLQGIVGLALFFTLIGVYMAPISERVLEGIRLQLANAALAGQLRMALQLVQQDAATDALTGQPNRRALDRLMAEQAALAGRDGRPFSLLLLDIDHFKQINDTHGHAVGDEALKAFAARVREQLREGDVCARYGGEEFVVVLPDTDLATAREVAERLRHAVAERPLLAAPRLGATVSIGAAQFSGDRTPQQLLTMADAAVYAAKRGGRNQVQVSVGGSPPAG